MPPASAEAGNRIGLGVTIDDPGNSALVYLREINTELTNIRAQARSTSGLRFNDEAERRPAGQRKQEAVREAQDTAQAVTQVQTSQLSLFDKAHNQFVNNQTRRMKTLAEETRNAASQMKLDFGQVAAAGQQQLGPRNRTPPTLGAATVMTSGDPKEIAAQEAEEKARLFQERTVRRLIESQQRAGIKADWEFEQETRKTVGQIIRERETAFEQDAQNKAAKRRLNNAINARVAQIEEEGKGQLVNPITNKRYTEEEGFREAQRMRRLGYQPYGPRQETLDQRNQRLTQEIKRKGGQLYGPNPDEIDPDVAQQMRDQRRETKRVAQEEAERVSREKRDADRAITEEARRRRREAAEQAAREKFQPTPEQQAIIDRAYQGARGPDIRTGEAKLNELALRSAGLGPKGPQERELPRTPTLLNDQRRVEARQTIEELKVAPQVAQIDKLRDTLFKTRNEAEKLSLKRAGTEIGTEAGKINTYLSFTQRKARELKDELGKPPSSRRAADVIEKDLAHIDARAKAATERLKLLKEQAQNSPEEGGGGGGGPKKPQGIADAAGRIFRNLVLYRIFSVLTTDLVEYTKASIEASRASNDLDRAMASEAIQAQTSADAIQRSAEALRVRTGLSSMQSRQVELAGLRFAEEDPSRAPQLTSAAVDLAASRGIRAKDTPDFLELLRQRNSRTYKKLLGTTTEDIYRKYAETEVDSGRGQSFDQFGQYEEKFQTRYEAIQKYLSNMSEAQKAEATYNEVLKRGSLFVGEAAIRQDDLAGRLDRVNSRWQDAQLAVGNTILSMRPLETILADIATWLDKINFDKFRGSGPQGLLTEADRAGFNKQFRENASEQWAGPGSVIGGLIRAGRETYSAATSVDIAPVVNQVGGVFAGAGALIQNILGLNDVIPGAGGGMSDERRTQLAGDEEFAAQQRARLLQQSREGSYRYAVPEADRERLAKALGIPNLSGGSINYEQSRELQLLGVNTGGYKGYTEDDDQRRKRALDDRVGDAERSRQRETERAQSDAARQQYEDEKREAQELLNRQGSALAKIRENAAGAFQLITRVGQGVTGPDNPYVKIFSDGASMAERMKREFGQLGEATVQYFTDLENKSNALALTALRFETLAQSGRNLAEARSLERNRGVGLSGNEQRLRDAFGASVSAATENPELYNRARFLQTGYRVAPDNQLREQFDNLQRNQNAFAGTAGLGPEAQDAIQALIDKGVISLADKAGDGLARNPQLNYLRQGAIGAIRRTAQRNDRETERAMQRVAIGAAATADVDRLLDQQRQLAQREVGRGGDGSKIGRLLDRQILAISGAVPTSELSPKAYQGRIEALRREAVRSAQAESEAQEAVREGLRVQQNILANLQAIRSGILGGDMSLLIQVENDTKAQIDADKLKAMGKGLEPKGGLPSRTSQPGPPNASSATKFE